MCLSLIHILPFVLDKNAAKAALKKYYRGKRFLPNAFSSQNHIEEIKGCLLYTSRCV